MGFKLLPPQERRPMEEKYKLAFKGQKQHFEIEIQTKVGEEKWLEIYLNPILSQGMIQEVSGIGRDITDLKKYQRDLVLAREQAETSLKVKEQFLANMSHEIRTPMNGVIGMVDLLSDSDLDEVQVDYVQTIRKSSETLLFILNDILDLAKIEAGKMNLLPTVFRLEDLLERLMSLFSQVANQKGNRLSYHLDPQIPLYVFADETRLLQIFSNLTSNSLKFTENGSVSVHLAMENLKDDSFDLHVRVTDTGMGIGEEDLKILFHVFQQLDNSTTKAHGGTGLGLAISREFCQMMGGDIGVESEVGKGSTFWFKVRLKIGNSAMILNGKDEKRFEIKGSLAEKSPSILIVDDNATNRKVASQILIKAGCVVETVASGKEVIHMIQQLNHFDLIIMDIQMPEMDGMETTRRLKALKLDFLPPIIAMTAYAMWEDRKRFIEAGMDDYLAKPLRAQQLIQMVGSWIHGTPLVKNKSESPKLNINVVDQEVLASLSEAVGGDPEFVLRMLTEFIDEAKAQISMSKLAHQKNDCKGVQAELHTLKGNSGTLGAAEVHALSEKIEFKAKDCNFKNFKKEIKLLDEALCRFEKEIKNKYLN